MSTNTTDVGTTSSSLDALVRRIGLEGIAEQDAVDITAELMFNILARVSIEVTKVVPEREREQFKMLAKAGDEGKLLNFLKRFIPDVVVFTRSVARMELEEMIAEVNVKEAHLKTESRKSS